MKKSLLGSFGSTGCTLQRVDLSEREMAQHFGLVMEHAHEQLTGVAATAARARARHSRSTLNTAAAPPVTPPHMARCMSDAGPPAFLVFVRCGSRARRARAHQVRVHFRCRRSRRRVRNPPSEIRTVRKNGGEYTKSASQNRPACVTAHGRLHGFSVCVHRRFGIYGRGQRSKRQTDRGFGVTEVRAGSLVTCREAGL